MNKPGLTLLCAVAFIAANTENMAAQHMVSQNLVGQDKTAQARPLHPGASSDKKPSTAADPWLGTWKMDLSQSKLHGPVPKAETLVIQAVSASRIQYSIKSFGQNGQYTLTYDGKPDSASPVLIDGKPAGTAAYHRDTDHQYSGNAAMGKTLTTVENITLSPDNKKTTVKIHAKDDKGEYDEIAVYMR
jgi:hypothetical protein